jgi:hypothetical protein
MDRGMKAAQEPILPKNIPQRNELAPLFRLNWRATTARIAASNSDEKNIHAATLRPLAGRYIITSWTFLGAPTRCSASADLPRISLD